MRVSGLPVAGVGVAQRVGRAGEVCGLVGRERESFRQTVPVAQTIEDQIV